MTPEEMATCHARAFATQGRCWGADEFAQLLGNTNIIAQGDMRAFGLIRVVADEAELLTIAADPAHQRQGLARRILAALETRAHRAGAARIFLEVAANNTPAQALYSAAHYRAIARRKGYYDTAQGRVDAVIMEKILTGA